MGFVQLAATGLVVGQKAIVGARRKLTGQDMEEQLSLALQFLRLHSRAPRCRHRGQARLLEGKGEGRRTAWAECFWMRS